MLNLPVEIQKVISGPVIEIILFSIGCLAAIFSIIIGTYVTRKTGKKVFWGTIVLPNIENYKFKYYRAYLYLAVSLLFLELLILIIN
jgi:hypothetical protein